MGVDAADFNNDSHEDLLVANLSGEYADLYLNDGKAMFDDRSFDSGLAKATSPYTIFSIGFLDYDNDSWLDVFFAGGRSSTLRPANLPVTVTPLGSPKGSSAIRGMGVLRTSRVARAKHFLCWR